MSHKELMRFAGVFLGSFLLLSWGYTASENTLLQSFFIDTLTVKPSVAILNAIGGMEPVLADKNLLVSSEAILSVQHGCEGTEAIMLALAAFIAVPLSTIRKITGAALIITIIYSLNQARIVALFIASIHNRPLFNFLHGIAGPLLIVIIALIFFWYWALREKEKQDA